MVFTGLVRLDCCRCGVSSIQPLARLPSLRELDLSGNNLANVAELLSVLSVLKGQLLSLSLLGNPVCQFSTYSIRVLDLCQKLLYFDGMSVTPKVRNKINVIKIEAKAGELMGDLRSVYNQQIQSFQQLSGELQTVARTQHERNSQHSTVADAEEQRDVELSAKLAAQYSGVLQCELEDLTEYVREKKNAAANTVTMMAMAAAAKREATGGTKRIITSRNTPSMRSSAGGNGLRLTAAAVAAATGASAGAGTMTVTGALPVASIGNAGAQPREEKESMQEEMEVQPPERAAPRLSKLASTGLQSLNSSWRS